MAITVGVIAGAGREAELHAYLLHGSIAPIGEVHDTFSPGTTLRFYAVEDLWEGQGQAGRFSSGMFGARVCATDAERAAMVEEFRP